MTLKWGIVKQHKQHGREITANHVPKTAIPQHIVNYNSITTTDMQLPLIEISQQCIQSLLPLNVLSRRGGSDNRFGCTTTLSIPISERNRGCVQSWTHRE